MIQDVQEYIRTCDTCQKRRTLKDKIPLQKSQAPGQPFEHIGIDVIGPLPLTQTRKRYIVVSVDWFTKWPEAKALETADAQTIAEFLYLDIICRHGVPTQITSDRGTEFCKELIAQMNRTYRIKHIRTTAYHSQGKRLVERMNQTIKNTLSKLFRTYQDWNWYLPSALFAIRTVKQDVTKFSPFELVHGRIPRKEFGINAIDHRESHDTRIWSYILRDIRRLETIRRKSQEFIKKTQDRRKNIQDTTEIEIGDQVLLYRNIVESSWSAKLEPKWEGPFYVQDIKGTSIWIRKPQGTILPTPVHRTKIKKYYERYP